MIDRFDVLTFDCYGTLIDWEDGIVTALHRALPSGWPATDARLLERFAVHEAEAERGPYLSYREVLARSVRGIAADYEVKLSPSAVRRFSGSVPEWPSFPDSTESLRRLAEGFRMGVITNCDQDLFAESNRRLGVRFDWVVTADQVGSYKPSPANFERAFEMIPVPRERILHVAQSLYHDHAPAKALGMSTVWIDRRHDRAGSGATLPAKAQPDLTFPDLAGFADAAVPSSQRRSGSGQP